MMNKERKIVSRMNDTNAYLLKKTWIQLISNAPSLDVVAVGISINENDQDICCLNRLNCKDQLGQ